MNIGLGRNWLKLAVLTLGSSLWSCSDGVPTTVSIGSQSVVTESTARLRLEVLEFFSGENIAEITLTLGDTVEVLATLEDGEGNSIPGQTLYITSEQGNFFTESNLLTDHSGQATSLLLATVVGNDQIKVTTAEGITAVLAVVVNEE